MMKRRKLASKAEKPRREKVDWKTLEIVHPDAAGIDIGGREHWVAISPDRDEDPVRRFDCFTAELEEVGKRLVGKRSCSGGMQKTGGYLKTGVVVVGRSGLG